MYIYCTTNNVNNKIYVGKCKRTPDKSVDYFGSGIALKHAINKYGRDKFSKKILEDRLSFDNINDREKFWIKELESRDKGYNLTDGGDGVTNPTQESRDKRSSRMKLIFGENHPHYGMIRSQESRDNISLSLMDRDLSEEHKSNVSKNTLGIKKTDKTKSKMSKSKLGKKINSYKAIDQINMESNQIIKTFESVSEIYREYKDITSYRLHKCLETEMEYKGYKWKYSLRVKSDDIKVQQIHKKTKEVINTFDSINEAIENTGIKWIGHCISGFTKSSGGFIWRKLEENIWQQ